MNEKCPAGKTNSGGLPKESSFLLFHTEFAELLSSAKRGKLVCICIIRPSWVSNPFAREESGQ
jgi:hypothetical protein